MRNSIPTEEQQNTLFTVEDLSNLINFSLESDPTVATFESIKLSSAYLINYKISYQSLLTRQKEYQTTFTNTQFTYHYYGKAGAIVSTC
jgi:hypothetical protein